MDMKERIALPARYFLFLDLEAVFFLAVEARLAAGFFALGLAFAFGFVLVDFLGLAAGLAFFTGFAAFFAAGACFFLAGDFAGSAFAIVFTGAGSARLMVEAGSVLMAGAEVEDVPDVEGAGMAGLGVSAAGPVEPAAIASCQPGVNISSRSREIGLARPQRGQWAS
jgi:hypothetical protein